MLAKDDVDEAGGQVGADPPSRNGEAKTAAREARDIFQDLEDPYGEARALNLILSANMLHEADAVDALFAAKDVLWLFRGNDILPEEEDKKAIADALHCQAKVHFSIGELADAREVAEESLKYYAQAQMTPKELRLRCIFSDSRILEKRHESLVQFTRSASAQRSLEEAAYGQGYALQTLAHILCAELSPDEGLPHSERAVELFATAQDQRGEAMAKAILAYQDTMSRMKQLEDTPQAFTEQSNARVTQNWTVIDDAMVMMREIRNQEGEDTIGSLIYEMNQKVGFLVGTAAPHIDVRTEALGRWFPKHWDREAGQVQALTQVMISDGEIQKKMSTPTKTVWTVDRVTRKAKQKDSAVRSARREAPHGEGGGSCAPPVHGSKGGQALVKVDTHTDIYIYIYIHIDVHAHTYYTNMHVHLCQWLFSKQDCLSSAYYLCWDPPSPVWPAPVFHLLDCSPES
ncbi:Ankyrin repeat domain-containing protein 29 [Durusdinium trenchii]|uniref:Ankyrin repeat domain-containing protein 29 n=1 Tax=Durusdinium trenchii TaxID=1381693 RepID=A0ABP0IQN0_9DINO